MKDVFGQITRQLVDQLKEIEEGRAPAIWFKPWTMGNPDFPSNQLTGNHYNGMNALLLYMTSLHQGYRTNKWMTFHQKNTLASQLDQDLRIRKGEHGYPIFRYVEWTPKNAKQVEGKEAKKAVTLKQFTVFNLDQLEEVPEQLLPKQSQPDWSQRYSDAHNFVNRLPCEVVFADKGKAYYIPGKHRIVMPPMSTFKSEEHYLATMFHEHVHSTANAVEREQKCVSAESYAREELVAEIGSALLSAQFGLEAPMQHPEYLHNYIKGLENSDREFWTAASQAQKAVTYLMSFTGGK